METFQDYQRELLARRVRLHRQGQRDAGLRPRRRAIRMVYGAIDAKTQREVDRALALHLGLVR